MSPVKPPVSSVDLPISVVLDPASWEHRLLSQIAFHNLHKNQYLTCVSRFVERFHAFTRVSVWQLVWIAGQLEIIESREASRTLVIDRCPVTFMKVSIGWESYH